MYSHVVVRRLKTLIKQQKGFIACGVDDMIGPSEVGLAGSLPVGNGTI